jgi:uncharacterized RDD family membrane protein YckC
VIDPGQLVGDIAGNAISLAIPGLLWAALFLFAFEHGRFAASVGLGRRAFWLLLPGALASSLGNLPFFPVANDLVGISLAGALFPILIGLLAFSVLAPPSRRSVPLYLASLLAVGAGAVAVVVLFASPIVEDLAVLTLASAGPLVLVGLARGGHRMWDRVAFLLALTDGVLVLTFLFSAAVPGVGITEGFPQYLLPPVAVGVIAVLAARSFLPGEEGLALPAAFIASTFGVLLGADLLRQPPLYPSSQPGLYVIGGAGIFDLVYLSGLLALASGVLVLWLLGRGWAPVRDYPESPPSPVARLNGAFRAGIRGDLSGSLKGAALASHEGAAQAHRLLGLPEAPPDRPWQGLRVPGWVVSDQANLDASARAGTTDGRESYRSWLMARSLVQLSTQLGSRRFASATNRGIAFGIDLAILTAPAVAVWAILCALLPGDFTAVVGSIDFNAAIYAYISVGFLYFVLLEVTVGTTPGKMLRGLAVSERELRPPTLMGALVRNSFKVPTLSVLGVGLALATAFLVISASSGSVGLGGISISEGAFSALFLAIFVVVGVGLLGLIGFLAIAATSEHQRLGDLIAGTWVVRGPMPRRAPVPPAPRAPGSSG